MSRELTASSILSLAHRLLGLTKPAEILESVCREAQRWLGADYAYVSYVGPGQPWERATHLAISGADAVGPAAASALFAVHRRVVRDRGTVCLRRSDDCELIFDALSPLHAKAQLLHAIPVVVRPGQVGGEIVLLSASEATVSIDDLPFEELARLASKSLDIAQQFVSARKDQERLAWLGAASAEAVWDWNLTSEEFWWGGNIHNVLGAGPGVRNLFTSKFDRVDPADVDRVRGSFANALASMDPSWSEEYRLLSTDGSRVDVEDRAYFLRDALGHCYRVVGAVRDIGPLKQLLAREKEARQQAEAASRTKDEFLAMLGHELRNPLAPILMALQLMRNRDDHFQREHAIIERQAQHMVRLVDDLLDVSRIARGLIELKREPLELNRLVAESLEMARPLIEGRGHTVEVDVPVGLVTEADRARIAQVFSNLITNAAKYTEPGGRIRIGGSCAGGWIEIAVADTGIGISSELLPHVFDMFVQESQSSDRARGGLGLGLSIVRSLVERHGGTVTAQSEGHGRGSRFTVRLPSLESEQGPRTEPSSPSAAPLARCGLRVLVVDDNQDAADLLGVYLARLGHRVEVVHDGPSALERLESFTPDLALVDIGLPVMDGYQLVGRLRERLVDLRVIAVTGYGQSSDRERALAAGFDEHVVKPLTMVSLTRLLQ